jgi:hypothetical protein
VIELLMAKGLGLLADVVTAKGKEWVEDKTGVKLTTELSSEQLAQLKKYELDNSLELQKLLTSDVQSARQRESDVAKTDAPLLSKVIVPLLALLVVIGGGFTVAFSELADVRTAASNLMMLVLGYYFGTSQGGQKAQEFIRNNYAVK